LLMVRRGEVIPVDADLVIIPGSKATIADLGALQAEGWDIDLKAHLRRGGRVLGVCGGYQMLGGRIEDPQGIEGVAGSVEGLGLLDVTTTMEPKKTLLAVSGTKIDGNAPFSGYEMHIGVTSGPDIGRPVLRFDTGKVDGARSADDRVRGVYVHGLFADDRQRAAWLEWIGAKGSDLAYDQAVEDTLEALARHLEVNVDVDGIMGLAK